jgi:hypothetical protein
MSRKRGGIYIFRCDKPGAVLGLPFIGRHNAYTGMTNSYYHRERQHLYGSSVYGAAVKPWADLRPKFYRILPLPEFLTHEKIIGRRLMWLIETAFIWLTLPVYNVRQQAPWNLRRISPRRADAQRIARMRHGLTYKAARTVARGLAALLLWSVAGAIVWEVWGR